MVECIECGYKWMPKRRRTCADGQVRCKPCSHKMRSLKYAQSDKGKAYSKTYYNENQDKVVARASKWGKENRERARVHEHNYRQTEKGKEVSRQKRHRRYWQDPEYERLKAVARHHGATPDLIREIYERDKVCQLCDTSNNLTIDHIYPVSKGGKSGKNNLQVMCNPCNSFKGNRLFLPDGGMLL